MRYSYNCQSELYKIVLLMILWSISASIFAQTPFRNLSTVHHNERLYTFDLPAPFNKTTLVIKDKANRRPESVELIFPDNRIVFSQENLLEIISVNWPEFSFDGKGSANTEMVDSLIFIFENGEGVMVDKFGVSECEDGCTYKEKEIIKYMIDKEFNFMRLYE